MRFLRNNGLSIALFLLFTGSVVGMVWSGWQQQNQELRLHAQPLLSLMEFLYDETFWPALFENWESEWLQMATYVVLTAYLFQKGSSESRDPDKAKKEPESASSGIGFMITRSDLHWCFCSCCLFRDTFSQVLPPTIPRQPHMVRLRELQQVILRTPSFGLSPSKTGNLSFSQRPCWSSCRFSSDIVSPRNPRKYR